MSDEVLIDAITYISSKRAANMFGYTQDYVGQLARKGLIKARRVGNHWYVNKESVAKHKETADAYVPVPPGIVPVVKPSSVVLFDGNEYISSYRASEETGYNADYVGQLARSGKILSRQIGNRWFIHRNGLIAHKKEKDALLASVQASSVGLVRADSVANVSSGTEGVKYFSEYSDLLPVLTGKDKSSSPIFDNLSRFPEVNHSIPSPVLIKKVTANQHVLLRPQKQIKRNARKTSVYISISSSVLTIMLLISFGLYSFKSSSTLAKSEEGVGSQLASSAYVSSYILQVMESIFTKKVIYLRSQ